MKSPSLLAGRIVISLDLELYLQLLNNNDNYTTRAYAALKMHLFNRLLIVSLVSLNQCFYLRQQAHGAHLRNQRKRLTNRRPLFLIPGYSRRKLNVRIVFPRSHYELNSHRRNLAAGNSVGANTRLYHARKIVHPYANDKVIPSTENPVLLNDLKIVSTYRGRSGDHSKQLENKPVGSSTVSISYPSLMRVSNSVESYSNRRMPSFTRESVTHLKDFIEKVTTTPNPATLSPFYTTSVLYKLSSLPLEVMGNNDQKIENNKTVEATDLIVANVVKGSSNGFLNLQTVREQVKAVLLISNDTSRRETMKDLVKRIVSESGLLSPNSSNVDIATLDNILEMIKDISNRLNASSDMDNAVKQVLKDNAIVMENKTVTLQETSTILNNKEIPIDNKGKTNLWPMESQETNVKLPDIAIKKSPLSSTDILREFKQNGRHTLKHLAGKSIYGDILPTSKSVDTPLDFRMSQQGKLHSPFVCL